VAAAVVAVCAADRREGRGMSNPFWEARRRAPRRGLGAAEIAALKELHTSCESWVSIKTDDLVAAWGALWAAQVALSGVAHFKVWDGLCWCHPDHTSQTHESECLAARAILTIPRGENGNG